MNAKKEPLLKKSIELDVLTKEGQSSNLENQISHAKRTNLKKPKKSQETETFCQNDYYHDSKMFSKLFFTWVSTILEVSSKFFIFLFIRKREKNL